MTDSRMQKTLTLSVYSLLADERKNNPSATAMQKFLAVALIMKNNKVKYEPLWSKLENDLLVGQDSYQKTIVDTPHTHQFESQHGNNHLTNS